MESFEPAGNVVFFEPSFSVSIIAEAGLAGVSEYPQIFFAAERMRKKVPDADLILAAFRRFAQVRGDREMLHLCSLFDDMLSN